MATHSSSLAWKIPWAEVHGVTKSWTQPSMHMRTMLKKVSAVENDLRCELWVHKNTVGIPPFQSCWGQSPRESVIEIRSAWKGKSGIPTSMEYTVPGTASAEWVKERELLREPDLRPLQQHAQMQRAGWGERSTRRSRHVWRMSRGRAAWRLQVCSRAAKMSLRCPKGLIPALWSPQRHQWQSQFKL